MKVVYLSPQKLQIMKQGGVWVPAPLALNRHGKVREDWQRLLTLYYIRSGARTIIPGTHTGEFALGDIKLYENWLRWNKEMIIAYGRGMFLMAAVSNRRQAELAVQQGYDIVMVSPKAFVNLSEKRAINYCRDIASIIPVFGFYLQSAVGGAYLSPGFWRQLFEFAYGAKIAPFNRARTLDVLRAAAETSRLNELVFATGNDDHIVYDLYSRNRFAIGNKKVDPVRDRSSQRDDRSSVNSIDTSDNKKGKLNLSNKATNISNGVEVNFNAGLLGHFATDTMSAVKMVQMIIRARQGPLTGQGSMKQSRQGQKIVWAKAHSLDYLAAMITYRNYVLFDARNNFQNCITGVKIRLRQMGLLSETYVCTERKRDGLATEIKEAYKDNLLTDDEFVKENLKQWKREVGIRQ